MNREKMNTTASTEAVPFSLPHVYEAQLIANQCEPTAENYRIVVVVFSYLEVLCNLLLLLVIITQKRRLKHNLVYLYVGNIMVVNIALGLLTAFSSLESILHYENSFNGNAFQNASNFFKFNHTNSAHISEMKLWSIRRALGIGIFLIMSGSVTSLILGISDSALFVGKSGSARANLSFRSNRTSSSSSLSSRFHETNRSCLTKRKRAFLLISLTWIIPLIYTSIALTWNCIEHCECLPGSYRDKKLYKTGTDTHKCSNVWSPLTNGYLILGIVIWTVQSVGIFVMLFYAYAKYKSTLEPILSVELENANNTTEVTRPAVGRLTSRRKIEDNSHKEKPSLHPTIKLMIALAVSYTACVVPVVISSLVDIIGADIKEASVSGFSAFIFLYCIICPICLIIYMPGLRLAISRLCLSFPCTTTTVKR